MGVPQEQWKYRKIRAKMLEENPQCNSCGIDHELSPLEYHHIVPRYTGQTDHTKGELLCKVCHRKVTSEHRRAHKKVGLDGYSVTNGINFNKSRRLRRERKMLELLNAYSPR